jgi:microcystin-dependent protein
MSCYISGLNLNRLDLVYQSADIVSYSNILTEITYLHQVDSNLQLEITTLSNNMSNITIDLSPVYSNINHLYQNDSNLNIGISNNNISILNLENDIDNINYALSNLPPVDLTNIYDNLNHLYQNDSNLNIGISNNLNSIQNINSVLSNQILKEENDILNLNIGYSNNLNSILNVNTSLSNQILKETNDILNINVGISNNNISILNLENDIDNLNFALSNLPPVDLTNIYDNLNHLYANDSNLNIGISNNLNSILNVNTALSNQAIALAVATAKEANDILNLNIGYSNNLNLIQGNAISLNQGYSNNLSSINNLSGLTSNYATLGTLQTLSNKTMDFNQNTFLNFATGSTSNYYSSNYYLNDQPLGAIIDYAGSSAPTDWLVCDGSAISRTSFSALFAIIGTTYGVGDNSTTFNIPNLKGRVSAGYDVSNSVLPFSSTLGAIGGSISAFGSNATNLSGAIVTTTSTGYSLSTTSNIQPTIILNKIIKYTTSALSTQNAINIQNVYNPYWGRVFMNTGYSNLVNGVWTDMPNMQVAYGNTQNSFNTTTNTYTCPVSGLYRMSLGAEFINGLVTNVCWVGLIKNGTTLEVNTSRSVIQEGTTVDLGVSDIIELIQGDTIKLQCMVQGNSTTDVKGAAYSQRGEDITHFSWQLESANTLVTAGSNIYTSMSSNINQTASNLVLFKGSGYELIDGGSIPNFSAYNLKSATTSINVSSATAPSSNQVLTATSASNAVWTTPTAPTTLSYSVGSLGKNPADASTTNTYAHGLGKTPTRITFNGFLRVTATYYTSYNCVWCNSGCKTVYVSDYPSVQNNLVIFFDGGSYQTGVVTVDATNITIVWTRTGTPSPSGWADMFTCEG